VRLDDAGVSFEAFRWARKARAEKAQGLLLGSQTLGRRGVSVAPISAGFGEFNCRRRCARIVLQIARIVPLPYPALMRTYSEPRSRAVMPTSSWHPKATR
jgi:hypothetical protein